MVKRISQTEAKQQEHALANVDSTKEIKLCKNCKHSVTMSVGRLGCTHKHVLQIDCVDGQWYAHPCFRARHNSDFCKQDGIFYEEIERVSILEFIRSIFGKRP